MSDHTDRANLGGGNTDAYALALPRLNRPETRKQTPAKREKTKNQTASVISIRMFDHVRDGTQRQLIYEWR